MAWVKVDDGYTEHLKVFKAGELLGGRYGYARAVAVDLQGMCYANRAESDGYLPRNVVKSFHDPAAIVVADALVKAKRWVKADGGYVIHDFLEYQPLAADLKEKRRHDRERKRSAKKGKIPAGIRAESEGPSRPVPINTNTKPTAAGAAGFPQAVENSKTRRGGMSERTETGQAQGRGMAAVVRDSEGPADGRARDDGRRMEGPDQGPSVPDGVRVADTGRLVAGDGRDDEGLREGARPEADRPAATAGTGRDSVTAAAGPAVERPQTRAGGLRGPTGVADEHPTFNRLAAVVRRASGQ